MAVFTATKSGAASSAETWDKGAEKPGSTSELVVPTGIEVKVEALLTVISAKTEGTGTFAINKNLTLTGSGNSLNLSASTVLGGTAKIILAPAAGQIAEPLTNGVAIPALTLSQNKLKLPGDLTVTGAFVHKGTVFTTESHAVTVGSYEAEGATTKELIPGTTLFRCTSGGFSATAGVALTIKADPWTLELTSTSNGKLSPGTHAFNVVTIRTTKAEIEESGTFAALNLLLTGPEAERVVKITKETTTTVTSFTTSAGVQLVSSEAGKAWKIKASGTITIEGVSLKDSTAETGTFKDVNGTDAGGNNSWIFAFTGSFTQSVALPTSLAARKVSAAALNQSTALTTTTSARKVASSVLSQSVKLGLSITGLKRSQGAANQQVGLATALQGLRSTAAHLASKLGLIDSSAGQKVATGTTTTAIATSSAMQGEKVGLGAILLPLGARAIIAGSKATRGELLNAPAIAQQVVGGKSIVGGPLANAITLTGVVVGMKVTNAAMQTQAALSQIVSAAATRLGELANALGLTGIFTGQQVEGEVVRLTVEIDAIATIPVSLEAHPTMAVDLTAVPLNP